MIEMEFVVPKEQQEYIEYMLANRDIECDQDRKDYQTIYIFKYKDGSWGYDKDVIARERNHKLLSYEEGFKEVYWEYSKKFPSSRKL